MLLAYLALPGNGYIEWLRRLYAALAPETAIEIGVYRGASLALFRPPTVAIGVDPDPKIDLSLGATTQVVRETSDEFFRSGRAAATLAGRPLSVGFIDGLHLFEQALSDFIHLESLCGPRSIILVHDTLPLDERSQERTPNAQFHSGDVWKIVPCLKHYRPDLDVFTIAAPPTGLTVITRLDPTSRVLVDKHEEAVGRFMDLPYAALARDRDAILNVVPNDWAAVQTRLTEAGILRA